MYYYDQNSDQNQKYSFDHMQNEILDFQSFDTTNASEAANYSQFSGNSSYMEPQIFTPTIPSAGDDPAEFDEPPLLEELEIFPDRILEKTLAVLNPFKSGLMTENVDFLTQETDLAGPITFCLILAVCLFLSGSTAHFGYIYGLSVVSCILMYLLLTLMTNAGGVFTLASVASIMGYCLLPIVGLSGFKVFFSLKGVFGMAATAVAVVWSSISASRLFVIMSGDTDQRPLIAYPCALVCGVFALLVLF